MNATIVSMTSYYSTFITGTQEIIPTALKQKLKDVQIDTVLDGLVVYKTAEPVEKIKDLRFFNNTFVLLFRTKSKISLEKLAKTILGNRNVLSGIPKVIFKNKRSFRVITSDENETVSINKSLLAKTENVISKKLKLKTNRSLPDLEFWFLKRSEGYGFIGIRITKTPNYEKTLHKGELRPELANLMCLTGDLKQSDVVLDPFAGYGSIPIECVKSFKVKQIIASEKDKEVFKLLEKRVKEFGKKIVLGRWDALNLTSLTNSSVDRVITDPPWGLYSQKNVDIEEFYQKMMNEFSRILKPGGLLVLLTAQKEILEKTINRSKTFKLLSKYDVLVSGKKAAIYKIGTNKKTGS